MSLNLQTGHLRFRESQGHLWDPAAEHVAKLGLKSFSEAHGLRPLSTFASALSPPWYLGAHTSGESPHCLPGPSVKNLAKSD